MIPVKILIFWTSTRLTRKIYYRKEIIITIYSATTTRFSCVRKNFMHAVGNHENNDDIKNYVIFIHFFR